MTAAHTSLKKVLLFAPKGFEDIELAAFTDILGWTRVLKETRPVGLEIAGFKRYITSKHGLSIRADMLLRDVKPAHYCAMVIPGGFNDSGWTEVYKKPVLDLIKKIHGNGGIITAMCVASMAVAKSGILRGKKATTYTMSKRHDNLQVLRECGANAVKKRIVIDDRIITNRGTDTSIDVAFTLLKLLNGKKEASLIKRALMYN
jgi:4-methyl-5(b-hydroxyethyl)-thiazole monophosphate biosynthesis